jgi:hypothetical protein
VSAFDPHLHEQGRNLEVIEARLARHAKVARRTLIGMVILALSAFGVLVIHLLDIL